MRAFLFTLVMLVIFNFQLMNGGDSVESFKIGNWGTAKIYPTKLPSKSLVVLIEDEKTDVTFIQNLKDKSNVVVVSAEDYYKHLINKISKNQNSKKKKSKKQNCYYPAGDLENLSKVAQKRLKLKEYTLPFLVGYGIAGDIVSATLAQTPPNTFRGGIIIEKSKLPKFLTLPRPFCHTHNNKFSSETQAAEKISQTKWQSEFSSLIDEKLKSHDSPRTINLEAAISHLPLIEYYQKSNIKPVIFIFSGDGGWASIDKAVAESFFEKGHSIVGFNSLSYFWQKRSPEELQKDIEKMLDIYTKKWSAKSFILIGYSFGADVLPPVMNKLTSQKRDQIKLLALVAPGVVADYEFHLLDWVASDEEGIPLLPEIKKFTGKFLCVHGDEDNESICEKLVISQNVIVKKLPGGHHFDGDYQAVVDLIDSAGI